jgi:Putative DNA-binding domain
MKTPADWKEEDLQNLIDIGAEEGAQQEFKSAAALKVGDREKTEISKDVSSFANSAGGIIVYGMDEEPAPPHKATALSPINPQEFSKEWLEQVINSRVQPHIQDLIIRPIDIAATSSRGVSYVVIIPASFTAHQAYDRRYYKRYNFESVPMEDYEIRQTMNRRQKPTYKVALEMLRHRRDESVTVRAVIENTSETIGEKVSAILFAPEVLAGGPKSLRYGPQMIENMPYLGLPGEKTIALSPLTKAVISFHDFPIRLPRPDEGPRFRIIVRVYDEHGQAGETKFTIQGDKVLDEEVRAREKMSY